MLISQFSALRPVISLMISSGLVRNKNHLGVEISSPRKTCSSANGFAFHASSLNILVVASRRSKGEEARRFIHDYERKLISERDITMRICQGQNVFVMKQFRRRTYWIGAAFLRGEKNCEKLIGGAFGGRRRRANSNICGKDNRPIDNFHFLSRQLQHLQRLHSYFLAPIFA